MCAARPPDLPVAATVLVELRIDRKENKLWFETFLTDGFEPAHGTHRDWANMPVAARVESEWLCIIDGVFGSAILAVHRAAGRLPVCLPAEYDALLEEEISDQK